MPTHPLLAAQLDLPVEGMTCASCARHIENSLNSLDGVEASVNYATEVASVRFDERRVDPADLLKAVAAAGYKSSLPVDNDADSSSVSEPDDPGKSLRRRLIVSSVLSLPVLLLSMIPALQFTYWQWLALSLATPVALWGAYPFHRAAVVNLRHGRATMDTLISIGVSSAWLWSVVALFWLEAGRPGMTMTMQLTSSEAEASSHLYLEVAAVVTTFILAGRYFEARAKRQAGAAIKALLRLGAKDVAIVDSSGIEQRLPIDQLVVGNEFVVRPGEKIATDGVVVRGASDIDVSMLTGESIPLEVGPGSAVTGATINISGQLTIKATKVGADTALAQIGQLVTRAQFTKAPVQRLADRVSTVFVPVVVLIAAVTLGFWLFSGAGVAFAFSAAVAVLIIACPCALGLATPTALLVGTGRGAQLGLIIKSAEVLESTRRIDTVVLDKTGTVTSGRMTVQEVAIAEATEAQVWARVGAAERASEHPIAKAIADEATRRVGQLEEVTDFANHAGMGVSAKVDGVDLVVGRPALLASSNLQWPQELSTELDRLQDTGATVVGAGWGGAVRALIAVADTVKPTSAEAIDSLKNLGLRPVLLTGDGAKVASTVAEQVGISEVISEVLPDEKAAVIIRLQSEGAVVAMIGDGINDGPALAQADLGMSMGAGTDVAIESSDLTLVSGDLRAAPGAIQLSRATLSTIKANLFWAFAYNVAAIPVAAAGLLNPLIAGGAMAASSVFVVLNSLRLQRFSYGKSTGFPKT